LSGFEHDAPGDDDSCFLAVTAYPFKGLADFARSSIRRELEGIEKQTLDQNLPPHAELCSFIAEPGIVTRNLAIFL
jgi:hypothetical protein